MGYSGKKAKENWKTDDSILEGYNILKFAHAVQEVINEEKEKVHIRGIGCLGLRIGIHCGRIHGGIIGKKEI